MRSRGPARIALCCGLTALAVGLWRYTLPLGDSDIWFHLRYAEYFLEHRGLVPDHALFSWTPADNARIYCNWLAELVLLGLFRAGGVLALELLRHAWVLLFTGLVLVQARALGLAARPLAWLACLLGLLMAQVGLYCKPEIFSLYFLCLLVWIYWRVRARPRKRRFQAYLLPAVMLPWANSHGGVIFGCLFLGLVLAAALLDMVLGRESAEERSLRPHLLAACLLGLAALCLTPYGLDYPRQLVQLVLPGAGESVFPEGTHIGAYQSSLMDTAALLDFRVLGLAALALLLRSLLLSRLDLAFALTNLGFACLYGLYFRSTYYWVPVLVFGLLHQEARPRPGVRERAQCSPLLSGTLAAVLCLGLAWGSVHDLRCNPPGYLYPGLGRGEASPFECAEVIARLYPGRDIGNTYEAGSYLLWRLRDTGNRVMIDSRHFPYRAWSGEYFRFTADPWNNADFADRYPADVWCITLRESRLIAWFLSRPGWRPAFLGPNSLIMVRQGLPLPGERRSPALARVRSPTAAYYAFKTAVMLQDWEAARMLVARMPAIYRCAARRDFPRAAARFLQAHEACASHDYATCAALLEDQDVRAELRSDGLLAEALGFLAASAWSRGEEDRALELARRADRYRSTALSRYNLAVIQAWRACRGTGPALFRGQVQEPRGLPPALARNLDALARGRCQDQRPPLALPHAP